MLHRIRVPKDAEMSLLEKTKRILKKLKKTYPEAKCELFHKTPFQLLVSTILSAQCTDKRVNQVTPELFKYAPTPEDMVRLGEKKLSKVIHSCGFYQTKSKNIVRASQILLEQYQGQVPKTHEALMKLPGVGRKTANVVLFNVFGIPTLAVDTHVFRVANRLGITQGKTPDAVEQQLTQGIAKKDWGQAHHLLIFHGRYQCKARNPQCENCSLREECQYFQKTNAIKM